MMEYLEGLGVLNYIFRVLFGIGWHGFIGGYFFGHFLFLTATIRSIPFNILCLYYLSNAFVMLRFILAQAFVASLVLLWFFWRVLFRFLLNCSLLLQFAIELLVNFLEFFDMYFCIFQKFQFLFFEIFDLSFQSLSIQLKLMLNLLIKYVTPIFFLS